VYAAGVALFSGPGLDHWWGAWAAGGYALAAVAALAARPWGGRLAVALGLAGAVAAPAIWLMTMEPTTPDVAVVARSGVLLLHHGSPYLPLSALSAGGWLAYNPYLPVMALFGLPGALGVPGDTRPWLIAATFLLLYATFLVTFFGSDGERGPGRGQRALGQAAFWLACPIMAFPLAMGITDPPVIALTCLALALLARGYSRFDWGARRRDIVLAAAVLGVACAMKYTAWPALAIVAVMVANRDGVRSAVRFAGAVLAVGTALVVALAPGALRHPATIVANTVAYPLGLTTAKSPAQSPLPGHLIATLGPAGHLAALALLALAGLATAASLVIAPPTTPAMAARRIAIGLAALFLLSPATRFGYFIYPIALFAWGWLAKRSFAWAWLAEWSKAVQHAGDARGGVGRRVGRPGLVGIVPGRHSLNFHPARPARQLCRGAYVPGRPGQQVAALGQAGGEGGGRPVLGKRPLRVARHLQQVGADGVHPVVAGQRPRCVEGGE
jgi:hypothetical protein